MKVLLDTSVIVEIDRQNEQVVRLLQQAVQKGAELVVSTVTVAEILTGSYLRKDVRAAVLTAKEVLNQFAWIDVSGEVADAAAKLTAFLITEKRMIDYPDILIAATFLAANCDALLTLNRKDFIVFPNLKSRVYSPTEYQLG